MSRAALISIVSLALFATESPAMTRRACQRTCTRFLRQCTVTASQPRRCQRLLHRLGRCERRVACETSPPTTSSTTTTVATSTTTTTIAGAGAAVVVDAARASTKTFPLDGGTLTATGADGTVYSLTIPANALLLETAITMTPIVSIASGNLPGGALLGVDLQPSGLRLYQFAELTITPPQLGAGADVAGFSYEGDGDDLHRYPATLDAGRILLHVIHFSGAGANICVELCPPPIVPPPPPITESELEQLIASLDPHDPFYAQRLSELLHAYYDLFIVPTLPLMEKSCDYATPAIPKVLAWSRTNQILLAEQGFETENQTIGDSVVRSVSNCWSEATQTCLNPNDAHQVQNLLQIARQAELLGGDPEAFDLSQVRRCSGLWSGTITHEWKYDEDGDFEYGGAHETRQTRLLRTQRWEIKPHVIGDPCVGCSSQMFEATWTGLASADNLYVKDYGTCTDTVTEQGEIDGAASPSAFFLGLSRDQSQAYVDRATPGILGAPPYTQLYKTYDGTHVECSGYEENAPDSVYVAEDWTTWPLTGTGQGLPLNRTDPTIPTTTAGQKVDRQESTGIGGGLIVITSTWTWTLTIEPDAAQ
jgi:hypothetical protein